jgi:hypothetical protein
MTLNEAMTAYAVSPTEANKLAIVDAVAPELRAQIKDMAACIAKQQASLVAAKKMELAALDGNHTQPMLEAAMRKAVAVGIVPPSADGETYLKLWGSMQQVLDAAIAAAPTPPAAPKLTECRHCGFYVALNQPPAAAPAPIQSAELAELRRLAEAATPGEWVHRHDPGNPAGVQHGVKLTGEFGMWVCDCLDNADQYRSAGERNAAFIAAANPAVILRLLAALASPAAAPKQASSVRNSLLLDEIEALETIVGSFNRPDHLAAQYRTAIRAIAALKADLSAQQGQAKPTDLPRVLFDGFAVLQEVRSRRADTSAKQVSDVLDAVVRLIRATPAQEG